MVTTEKIDRPERVDNSHLPVARDGIIADPR
jgi:hypothetical protein